MLLDRATAPICDTIVSGPAIGQHPQVLSKNGVTDPVHDWCSVICEDVVESGTIVITFQPLDIV